MERVNYNLIFYDMWMLDQFLTELYNNRGKNISQVKYAWIFHDRDIVPETGEYKKPHCHLWLEFPSPVKSENLVASLNKIGYNESAISHEKTDRNFLAYLTHSTVGSRLVKASYDFEEIATNIDSDTFKEMYQQAVEHEENKLHSSKAYKRMLYFSKMEEDIEFYRFTSTKELLDLYIAREDSEMWDFVFKYNYTVFNNFKETFSRNRVLKSSSELEDIIKGEIE